MSHGRYFAEHIANARYVELDTDAHVPMFVDASLGETLTAIEEFVTGTVRHTADRRFAAILFVDIVDSTAQQRHAATAPGATSLPRSRHRRVAPSRITLGVTNGRSVLWSGVCSSGANKTPTWHLHLERGRSAIPSWA